MATIIPVASTPSVSSETPITIKVSVGDSVKKLKLPLKDLTADTLFVKVSYFHITSIHYEARDEI